MTIGNWCSTHKDAIAAAGVAVASVGFLATALGLGITIYQIASARKALQAANAYQIQKDARELAGHLAEDDLESKGQPNVKLSEYISGTPSDKFKIYDSMAFNRMASIFNFYMSVYRQYKNDGVTDGFAAAFGRDFCSLFKKPGVDRYWESWVKSSTPPSAEMREMRNAWCP